MPDHVVDSVTWNEGANRIDFHIPNPFDAGEKVVSVGKDEIEKVLKQIFPDELRKELGGALKSVEKDVLQQVVGKVVVPVLSEALKPVEKLAFSIGARGMQLAYDAAKELSKTAYQSPTELIAHAEGNAAGVGAGYQNPWIVWLAAMHVPGYHVDASGYVDMDPDDPDMGFWDDQLSRWKGWKPYVAALIEFRKTGGYSRDDLIADFNKISFYAANAGNLSLGFYWNNMYERAPHIIAELNKYKDGGLPLTRHAIHEFIAAVGPDSLDITASAKIELGISIGGSLGLWGVPTRLGLHFLDDILAEAGIPA